MMIVVSVSFGGFGICFFFPHLKYFLSQFDFEFVFCLFLTKLLGPSQPKQCQNSHTLICLLEQPFLAHTLHSSGAKPISDSRRTGFSRLAKGASHLAVQRRVHRFRVIRLNRSQRLHSAACVGKWVGLVGKQILPSTPHAGHGHFIPYV